MWQKVGWADILKPLLVDRIFLVGQRPVWFEAVAAFQCSDVSGWRSACCVCRKLPASRTTGSLALPGRKQARKHVRDVRDFNNIEMRAVIKFFFFHATQGAEGNSPSLSYYRGADKSLARPGRKQARKHVRDARDFNNIEVRAVIKFFFSCKARRWRKFTQPVILPRCW